MATALETRSGVAEVMDEVRDLLPEVRSRGGEVESARRVPRDLLDRLKSAGAFGVVLPRSHGGAEGTLPEGMRFFEELSRHDASVGWITLIGGATWLDLAGLPPSTFDAMYRPGSVTVVAGVFNPTGSAVPVSGGYQVNGRWSFASGCEDADWIYGNCIDTSSGEPELRAAVLRPDEVEIEDTWRVVGLCGTGSHHFNAHDVVVPAERTLRVLADPPCVESPFSNIPLVAALALLMAAVPIGVAQAALDDIIELATDKVPLLSASSLAGNALFEYELADADASLRAAACTALPGSRQGMADGGGGRRVHTCAESAASIGGGSRGHDRSLSSRHRLPLGRRQFALPRESATASAARRARGESALLAQAGHPDDLRCRTRRAVTRPHGVLN